MSPPDKRDAARGWQFVEKLLADDDIERLDKASDEEVERQMDEQGVDATGVASADELLARVTNRASKGAKENAERPPATMPPLRHVRIVAWLAAAALTVLAIVIAVKRKELIAFFRHEPLAPVPTQQPLPRTPQDIELTRQERANELRREAYPLCGRSSWTLCEGKLDEAKALDPGGEQDPNVQTARRQIYVARHPDAALLFPDTKSVPDAGRR